MSGRRFQRWQVYEAIEPFGERARYWQAGQICAAFFNSQRTKKKDPIHHAEDFMPATFGPDPEEVPPVDEFAELKEKLARARGGKP